MKMHKDTIAAFFINVFFLALCLLFGKLQYGALDDFFMAGILTGIHGDAYNPHMYFVNVFYGYALLPLYHILPKIGWYYIGEMVGVFFSLTIISRILIETVSRGWGILLSCILVAGFCSDLYLVTQFTLCGALFSAAGTLSCLFGIFEKRNCYCIVGSLLILWGSMMRWDAFVMGIPFAALLVLFLYKELWNRKKHVVFWLGTVCIFVIAFHYIDRQLYLTHDYKIFSEFQGPRAALGDGTNYNMQAVYEDLEEAGKSGKDYAMLTQWIFYDTENFKTDSLREVLKYVEPHRNKFSFKRVLPNSLDVMNGFISYPPGQIFLFFCIIVFCSKKWKYAWLSLILLLAMTSYLLYLNRLVYRVEMGLLLYATVFTIPLLKQIKLALQPQLIYILLILFALANVVVYIESGEFVRHPQNGEETSLVVLNDTTNYDRVFEYIYNNPSKMFLVSMNTYMKFARHKNPPYLSEPTGSFKRIVSIGYWTPYLPEITQSLKSFEITNPLKDVVKENVIVIDVPNIKDYLQRHYYDSVSVRVVNKINDITFYKYSVEGKR